MQGNNYKKLSVWILLSGGIDSTACVSFYQQQDLFPRAIFFDYGQRAAKREAQAARAVSNYYNIPLVHLTCIGTHINGDGIIYGRNAFFVFAALMETGGSASTIAMGIHSGTSYYDCSSSFAKNIQVMLDGYTSGRVQFGTPFLNWSKRDIWDFARSSEVPLTLTYSCELGLKQPCGKCQSCKDWEALYAYP